MEDWIAPNQEYAPPKPGEPPLIRAARLGDALSITRGVRQGENIDQVFDMALDPGAKPTKATPLMVAAGSGDGATVETIRHLIDLGADPKITLHGRSAATFAAEGLGWNYRPGGDAARLNFLLEAGSPLAASPEAANLALCRTAEAGDLDRLRILTAQGLNVNGFWDPKEGERRQKQAESIFSSALRDIQNKLPKGLGDLESMTKKFMEKMGAYGGVEPFGFEIPIFSAAVSGSAACVRHLIDCGANVFARESGGKTVLFKAGSRAVVMLLIEQGLSTETPNRMGWTPLVDAVNEGLGAIQKVRWLIAAGADVNGVHDRGFTVFMSAASSSERHVKILKLLVDAGANPFAITELGFNAFHAAIDVNGPEANEEENIRSIFGYLKELGVDIHHTNGNRETPLMQAKRYGTETEVKVLRELGAKR